MIAIEKVNAAFAAIEVALVDLSGKDWTDAYATEETKIAVEMRLSADEVDLLRSSFFGDS